MSILVATLSVLSALTIEYSLIKPMIAMARSEKRYTVRQKVCKRWAQIRKGVLGYIQWIE